ncbi:MAG TPA: protein translocase subunit SecD [Tissierellaceae bacterium]|nr:protein translocase subunit SecD [Tissierellaceae bacterium]
MKIKDTIILILILAIIGGSTYVAFNGLEVGKIQIKKAKDSIDLGLDLAGGVYVVLEANTDAKGEELAQLMNQTKAIIEERVDGLGISEPSIMVEGDRRIRVELAGVDDPQEAIDLIGKTAQLQFIEPNGDVVLTGKNVKNAGVAFQKDDLGIEQPVVTLELDKEGAEKFAQSTGRLIGETNIEDRIIFIVLDDQVISSPAVKHINEGGQPIDDGKAVISGNFEVEEASYLATLIRAGALPVDLVEQQTSVIGPTLGLEAFEKSIKAGGIALLLIFIFMISIYKLPGLIASIGLIAYTLIIIFTMILMKVKLTLPGIAGLVLSIGMAVDTNILIFERIRDELLIGKTLRASVDLGFKRALTSVLDSNITTLIAGIVLYYFGVGPIRGFGITLIIGILTSMVTAILLSKYLMKLTLSIFNFKSQKIYGA